MRRAVASSLLSLLLLTTLMWGGCISCEQYFMWPGAKGCCAPDGHCEKTPAQPNSGRECKLIVFDHQESVNLHVDLPVVADIKFDLLLPEFETIAAWRGSSPIAPSPPDLQALHSIFLI